jgi:uncharacterized protein (TIGR02453 family)
MNQFNGFTKDTLKFLEELKNNNNKIWFEKNRKRYEKILLEPFKLLVCELSPFILKIDQDFETTPKVDKTISRIYRDTRFSKDKSPYRPNMWITFKRRNKEWKTYPAFFFELYHDWYRYGMGFYSANKVIMDKFRNKIENNIDQFKKITSFLNDNTFLLEGGKYKRIINDTLPIEIQKWHQRKTFYLVCNRKINNNIFSNKIITEIKDGFMTLTPLYRFLINL